MLRQRLPLMFIAVSALSAVAAHAEDRLLLKSVNVDLPVGDRMFWCCAVTHHLGAFAGARRR